MMEQKNNLPLSERSNALKKVRDPRGNDTGVFRFPGLSLFLKIVLFCGLGTALLWYPTQKLWNTYQTYHVFEKYSFSDMLPSNGFQRTDTASKKSSSGTVKKPRPVVFQLFAPAAKIVFLGGTFNNYDARKHPMKRQADGTWEATVSLLPGRYFYKFKVDGQWTLDPANPEKTPEPKVSSILEIK